MMSGIQTVQRSSFGAANTAQLSSPLLPTFSASGNFTIGEFLTNTVIIEDYSFFLHFIGAFYKPQSFTEGNRLSSIWKACLLLWVIGFIVFGIYVFIIDIIVINKASFFYCMWAASILFQGFICIPVLFNIRKRFHNTIDTEEQTLFLESLQLGKLYMIICIILISIFTVCLVLLLHKDYALWIFLAEGFFGLCPMAISCVSTWALIFILFDCKVINKEISSLHKMGLAKDLKLNCDYYNKLHSKLKVLNSESIVIADGIALVAYFNMVVFFFTFFITFKWNNIVGSICLCFREVLLLMFVLPKVSEVNGHYDTFCSFLINDMYVWNGTNTNSTAGSAPIPETYPTSHQLEYVRLYTIMTIDKPLSMTILGRRIQRLEMKAQVIGISLLAFGTCLSIIFKHILNIPNQYD